NGLAQWDGSEWSPLRTPIGPAPIEQLEYFALEVFDDGSGPALYLGGVFQQIDGVVVNNIAKWDGSVWTPLQGPGGPPGTNNDVLALQVFDDGSGPALFAAGAFSSAGGVEAESIAKWDGAQWSSLRGTAGFQGLGGGDEASALQVYDDGTGEALYVGGRFNRAGGINVEPGVARWDGTEWSALRAPNAQLNGEVTALGVFHGSLYLGGQFALFVDNVFVKTRSVVAWNGTGWDTTLGVSGEGVQGNIDSLQTSSVAGGEALYVGGEIFSAGNFGVNGIARWDGTSWGPLQGGAINGVEGDVRAIVDFDDGSGRRLFVGGEFARAGGASANSVAAWNGVGWSAIRDAGGNGFNGQIEALELFDDGTGEAVYAAGFFSEIGDVAATSIARWDGQTWTPLVGSFGEGVGGFTPGTGSTVLDIEIGDTDGQAGSALYVAGGFFTAGGLQARGVARWDGSEWSALTGPGGGGLDGSARAVAVFDDGNGPAVYVAGSFASADGIQSTNIARWDGTQWSPLQGPFGEGIDGFPLDIEVYDDGSGPALYVAGVNIRTAGGVPVTNIAKWDGTQWSALQGTLGEGINSLGWTLTVYDNDGTGADLWVGGDFGFAGGIETRGVARWDGVDWSAVTDTSTSITTVRTLEVIIDDGIPRLYAGGGFRTLTDGTEANGVAFWTGTAWRALTDPREPGVGGLGPEVKALLGFDPDGPAGPATQRLLAGGNFATAGGRVSSFFAQYGESTNVWARPTGGLLDNPASWLCGRALSPFDSFIIDGTVAGYASPAGFGIAFPSDLEPQRAETFRQRTDIVALNLAGQSLELTGGTFGFNRPALVVGELSDQQTTLLVRNFGPQPLAGVSGRSLIIGDAPTAQPGTINRLQVQDTNAFLLIDGDASIGRRADRGELVLQGQAVGMLKRTISIGTTPGSVGEIRVQNAGTEFFHSERPIGTSGQSMAIGESGFGSFVVGGPGAFAGATAASLGRLDTLTLGTNQGSRGVATIRGVGSSWSLDTARLRVGVFGEGQIEILDGGVLSTNTLGGVEIGVRPTSVGRVVIEGPGSRWTETASAITVGLAGEIAVGTGGVLEAPAVQIDSGGRLTGDGRLGSGDFFASVTNFGEVSPGDHAAGTGVLSVEGDYRQIGLGGAGDPDESGTLRIRVSGSGVADRLQVTGTAELGGGLIIESDGSQRDLLGLEPILSAGVIGAAGRDFDVVQASVIDVNDGGVVRQGTLVPVVSAGRGLASVALEAVTLEELLFGGSEFVPDGVPNDAVLGDVTGDGVDDLAIAVPFVTGSPNGAVALLRGDLTNGFSFVAVDLYLNGAEVDAPTSVEIGDFDADGANEIAFASGGDAGVNNDVHVIEFDGVGLLDSGLPAFLVAEDSRIVDLASSDGFFTTVGTGLAILEDTATVGSSRVNVARYATTDWEFCPLPVDDDDPDAVDPIDTDGPVSNIYSTGVAVTTRGADRLTVFLAQSVDATPEEWDFVAFATGTGPGDVRADDLDGDGIDDLVVINQTAGTLSVLRTRGGGDIAPPVEVPASSDPVSLSLVDVDEDGDRDVAIVVSNGTDRVVRQLRNTTSSPGSITLAAAQDISDQSSGTPVLIRSSDLDGSNGVGGVADDIVILVEPGAARGGGMALNAVRLSRDSCLADSNGDGTLSPADFNAWILAFTTQSAACDQNIDGLCTPADFNAWILNFNAGCD
ncbi:MAG: FG-GAP-like repeat-containing protein, partial [Planctomycetota bacterium]